MNKICICLAALVPMLANAGSTINSSNSFAWGANLGYMSWRPTATDGVSIGEFICSGYIYAANVGWINLGSGFPANGIQYSNSSATDFGVNYTVDPFSPGEALLRGLGYGANIGWINFHSTGNPRVRLTDGRLLGYAWSANCGWINLGELGASAFVQTDTIAPGVDSNGNGLADAWELFYFGFLGVDPNGDPNGNGLTNLQDYLSGNSPVAPNSGLRIIALSQTPGTHANSLITWTSNAVHFYNVETTTNLIAGPWVDAGLGTIIPDSGTSTTSTVSNAGQTKRFYRVRAIRPLMP